MANVRLALRTLFKTPFVTAIAVLSLSLGIGANVAIFSMFDQMLLRPLPVVEPGRLVNLSAPGPKPGSQSCGQAGDCDVVFSYPMFRDLERATTPFSGIAAHFLFRANLAYHDLTLSGDALFVSGSYFSVLGLRPALGRLLTQADDQVIGGHPVAVLGYQYWETRLGSSPEILNQTMIINGVPMTIVGVAPRGFEGTTLGSTPEIFVPITMRKALMPLFSDTESRRVYWAYLFGRLKPGVSIDQARTGINTVYHSIINDVEAPLQNGMSAATMAQFRAKQITLEPGRLGQSGLHDDVRAPVLLLLSITGIVLVIACANIANLLLARAAGRSMEMTLRLALGAGRRQLLAQLLTESCILGLLGGAGSLLVAGATLGVITNLLPATTAATLHFELDRTAIVFAGALSLATGVLFGIFPALHSTRPDLIAALSAGSTKHSGARSATRFRTSLVVAQIAFSMTLLISAGLFIQSLRNISRIDLGIRIDNVSQFAISPVQNGYQPARSAELFRRIEQELAAMPGVTAVAASMVPILGSSSWGTDVAVEGFEKGPDTDANTRSNEVGPGYFRALGIPLISGREFTEADHDGAPQVAVVNETFAKKFNLGRQAVGKRLSYHGDSLNVEIVGLVRDAKYDRAKAKPQPVMFLPYRQDPILGFMNFYVRSSVAPDQMLRAIPALIKKLDPNLPVERLKTLPQQARENVFLDRLIGVLSAAFAILATILAAVGLYGVLAFSVTQRTREIGVRMALGADRGRVRSMVLGQVGKMLLVGGAIGIGAALALGHAARSLLFGLEGQNPLLIAAALVLLAAVALGAGYLPALRASRIDPMQALRQD